MSTPQSRYIQRQRAERASISFLIDHALRDQMDADAKTHSTTRQAWIIDSIQQKLQRRPRIRDAVIAVLTLCTITSTTYALYTHNTPRPTIIADTHTSNLPTNVPIRITTENQYASITFTYSPNMHTTLEWDSIAPKPLIANTIDGAPNNCIIHHAIHIHTEGTHIYLNRTDTHCHELPIQVLNTTLTYAPSIHWTAEGNNQHPWSIHMTIGPDPT